MLHIIETSKFPPVLTAANALLAMIGDGKLFSNQPEHREEVIFVADRLEHAVDAATRELADAAHNASPFLRYRKELINRRELQQLVMFLFGGGSLSFYHLFGSTTPHETAIALRCIAHYSAHGENDPHFMSLAAEIHDERQAEKEAA